MEGWIKLYRKILDSDMYKNLNSKQRDVMITCLLLANHKESKWEYKGEIYSVKPGQFVTSLESLKSKCASDISLQNVRTALLKLEKWGFLTNQSTKTGRLITIVNWHFYQDNDIETNKDVNKELTKHQQRANKELTTNKNDIRMINNDKKNIYSDAVKEIFDFYLETFKGFFKTYTLTKDRKEKIIARLKEGYTVDQIKTAIRNIRQSSFHCGENDRNKFYADITFICRNGSKIEEWINYKPKQQAQTNNVVDYKEAAKSKYGW